MPIWSGCTGSARSVVGSCLFSFSHILSVLPKSGGYSSFYTR